MARIVVVNHVTLDGVMQSPASPDEDTRGGFEHGGWAPPYSDEVMGKVFAEGMARPGALLFGRRTYQKMEAFWPNQPDNPITDKMNRSQKYVVSTTLQDPLPWVNSTVLDSADAVANLKEEDVHITVLGSGELIQALMPRKLIDEFLLTIHPLVLGSGRRLFPDGGAPATFRLVDVTPTTTGVLIARYEPA